MATHPPAGTLITVAPTGAETDKKDASALPVTLPELIAAARACESAGASVIHVHLRDGAGRPTLDPVLAKDAVAALREATGLIVQLSTGGAVSDSPDARLRVLDAAPDSASITCGTVNFGDEVFENRWSFMVELYRSMQERGIVPEFELFDLGHAATLARLLDHCGPPPGGHVHADLVMGVPGGMPATQAALVAVVSALPHGSSFSATGVGRHSLPVALAALAGGGHLRVGMEDTLTFLPGEAVRDNAQLVSRAATLAALAGRPPLSPERARALLGVGAVRGAMTFSSNNRRAESG
ncbi:MAG: beta-keto acid cleavage family enzyme [Mycobacteriales bacterium]